MGLLTCGMCVQKTLRRGSRSGCALDKEAGHEEKQNLQKLRRWLRACVEQAPASWVGKSLACAKIYPLLMGVEQNCSCPMVRVVCGVVVKVSWAVTVQRTCRWRCILGEGRQPLVFWDAI